VRWEWQAADGVMGKSRFQGDARGPNPTDRAKMGSAPSPGYNAAARYSSATTRTPPTTSASSNSPAPCSGTDATTNSNTTNQFSDGYIVERVRAFRGLAEQVEQARV
jgi:hypothetical protein